MSKQAFDAFKAKLADDAALRQDMASSLSQGGAKTTASIDEVIAYAKTKGFDVDAADVRQSAELTDDQLDAVAGGAVDMFLKLDGIKGETSYKEQIEISSFSWGIR